MESYKYVIIGGGIAGGRAAEAIRKVDPQGALALVAGEPHYPYQRPPLSKGYLLGKEGLDKVYLKEDTFWAQNQIQIIYPVRATRLDPAAHRVTLDNGQVLSYEKALLATGGYALRLPLQGGDLPGVMTLRTLDDCNALQKAAVPDQRALVLGGSFIGCEVASALTQLGLHVTMVFPGARLLEAIVPQELSAFLRSKYEQQGVRIFSGAKPDRLEGNARVERAVLDHGTTLDVDLVVMGVGIRLNIELAREAGLMLTDRGAVLVDEYLRTSDPDIYAAGDIAAWPDATFGKRLRLEHWDVARQQGLRAGRNMAGEGKPYTTLPYFYSDLFDFSFEAWGDLAGHDAIVTRGSLDKGSFALYYFDQGKLSGVLTVGRPQEERKPMQALVSARPAQAEVAAKLQDESMSLAALVTH